MDPDPGGQFTQIYRIRNLRYLLYILRIGTYWKLLSANQFRILGSAIQISKNRSLPVRRLCEGDWEGLLLLCRVALLLHPGTHSSCNTSTASPSTAISSFLKFHFLVTSIKNKIFTDRKEVPVLVQYLRGYHTDRKEVLVWYRYLHREVSYRTQ